MEQNREKPIENPNFDENGKFKEGNEIAKLGGRPKGTRDFATDFDEVVKDIAKENNITVSDVRKVLLKQAYKQAKDGNYSFYKDIHDRVYGTATQKINVEAEINTADNMTKEQKEKLLKLLK